MSETICRWMFQTWIRSGITVSIPTGPGGTANPADNALAFNPAMHKITFARSWGVMLRGSVDEGTLVTRFSSAWKTACWAGSASWVSGGITGDCEIVS